MKIYVSRENQGGSKTSVLPKHPHDFPPLFPWFSQPFPHGPKAHRLQHPRSHLRPLPQSKQHRNLWDERETHGDSWGMFRDFSGILVGCLVGFHWYLTDSHYIYIYIFMDFIWFYMILWRKHKCQWVSERENSQEDFSDIRKSRSSMID